MNRRTKIAAGIVLLISGVEAASSQQDTLVNGVAVPGDSLYDLVDGLSEELLGQASEHEEHPAIDPIGEEHHVEVRGRVLQRLQPPQGYQNGAYNGSVLKSYQRILFQYGDISGGFLATKDPGERELNAFTTANLMARSDGALSKILLGDFRVEAGQGIALWRGYDFAKGSNIVAPVMKQAKGVVASLSSDEAQYFRGAAATIVTGPITSTLFYSNRSLNGTVDSSGAVTSFYSSAYFRNDEERLKLGVARETVLGVHTLIGSKGRNRMGLSIAHTRFGRRLVLDEGRRFSGQECFLASIDYTMLLAGARVFGEWAVANGVVGGISGVLLQPIGEINVIAAARHYPRRFFSFRGFGFGERVGTSNENGFYIGAEAHVSRSLKFSAYFDRYDFPEAIGGSKFGSTGSDLLVQLESTSIRRFDLTIRYHRTTNDLDEKTATESGLVSGRTVSVETQRIRLQGDYRLSAGATLRSRIEGIFWDGDASAAAEKGFLFYTEIVMRIGGGVWANFRASCFRTDSYTSRIAAMERDVEGVMAVPALYGSGIRWYWLMRYDVNSHMKLSAKYSDLLRDDVKYIGSGTDKILTNHDNRLGLQLDLSF